ncbi:PTS sugar transporter subunit IIC [Bombilactobacillus bombi]|uniref:PTS sugar transporter subunit IIC n=1 Tax=Bombilactobacillus bombi TaxID=1303590 RepID=UPI0015E5C300|nr:PTS sugar transporter subunit IIC [Bombilactobacillus bombi]MBA1434679.1 PTS sugar transporter subunit IIC [Bombilactobacillus bombi]
MFKFRYHNFLTILRSTFQDIYPIILIDAYLRLINNTLFNPNGFFVKTFHLGWKYSTLNRLFPQLINILELLILLFFGYLLTQKLSQHSQPDFSFNTVLILIIASINLAPDGHNTWYQPPILLVILISWLVAKLFKKIPWPTLRVSVALIAGFVLNQLQQSDVLIKLPGISTSARHINWWALVPLVIGRNLATWCGLINPFAETKQTVTTPAATANLSAALSHQSLSHLPFALNLHSIYTSYAFLGGIGCTLGLVFALLIVQKEQLVLQNILLSSFGFNAPLLLRVPVLFNIRLLVPFIISPLVSMLIGALFISLNWAQPAVYQIFAGTPSFLINFLGTNGNWGSLVATLLAIACSTAIYLPFVKAEVKYENQTLD